MTTILNNVRIGAAHRGLAVALCAAGALSACGSSVASAGGGGGRVQVAAAENFWGSIAAQIGGDHAQVVSVITSPDTDPHAYEPTPQDGRTFAEAQYIIIDGAGYDPWAPKLVDANPSNDRHVLTVADLAGRKQGDNPHMWYSPAIVAQVIARVTDDLKKLDSADAAYFDQQAAIYTSAALRNYDDLRAAIKARYSGVAVGATESLFVDLARDLGLDLVTPPEYMKAISEGNDPTAADKSTFDTQISSGQIKVLVFNKQNATPDIQGLVDTAHAAGIPVVAITETLDPASATFQGWQARQLADLEAALG
ncbi:MAG TPA: zinc ABC transporter substrate-binding protein, partial [Candidatus Dormibacteraeota bacterium]